MRQDEGRSGLFALFGKEFVSDPRLLPPQHLQTDEIIHGPVVLPGSAVFRHADSAQSSVPNRKATVQSPERLLRGPGLRPHVLGRQKPAALLRQLPAVRAVVAVALGASETREAGLLAAGTSAQGQSALTHVAGSTTTASPAPTISLIIPSARPHA